MKNHFRYLITIWSNAPVYKANRLRRFQNWCLKFLFQLDLHTSTTEVYSFINVIYWPWTVLALLYVTVSFESGLFKNFRVYNENPLAKEALY